MWAGETVGRHFGDGGKESADANAGRLPAHHAGHRRGDRHRNLRADGRGCAKGGPRHDGQLRHRRLRLRLRGALLCRNGVDGARLGLRSEEHTSELQSLMRISYAVFCLKKKKKKTTIYRENSERTNSES